MLRIGFSLLNKTHPKKGREEGKDQEHHGSHRHAVVLWAIGDRTKKMQQHHGKGGNAEEQHKHAHGKVKGGERSRAREISDNKREKHKRGNKRRGKVG